MYELKIISHFAAAHQLRMVSAKCENLHGHNWKIEVHIGGESLNPAGVLIDFGELKARVAGIIAGLDHRCLNELGPFREANPSSENIAFFIASELGKKLDDPGIRVTRVTAWESEDACATYIP